MITCPACNDTSRIVGHEISGVYDGVLFWSCACGHAWSRDWSGYGRRQEIADGYVATFLAGSGGAA